MKAQFGCEQGQEGVLAVAVVVACWWHWWWYWGRRCWWWWCWWWDKGVWEDGQVEANSALPFSWCWFRLWPFRLDSSSSSSDVWVSEASADGNKVRSPLLEQCNQLSQHSKPQPVRFESMAVMTKLNELWNAWIECKTNKEKRTRLRRDTDKSFKFIEIAIWRKKQTADSKQQNDFQIRSTPSGQVCLSF